VSLDYFETQYAQLGTKFDFYFFESEVAKPGEAIVKKFLKKGVFEESQGAIIFPGEKHGLHTRVFINSEGLPTYEAKELGLVNEKYKAYNYDLSVVVTGNEINQYFQVLLKAMSFVYPELEKKTKHIGHGMLRLPSGKMSSRTGSVIAAEDLLKQAEEKAREKETQGDETTYSQIAVAGVKFAILNQASGSDIVFDIEQSLSFEGDSGPYLQYTQARCLSVLRKAKAEKMQVDTALPKVWETTEVEKLLYRFPELVEKSLEEYSSHYIAHYLIDLARAYNGFYAKSKIIGGDKTAAGYKLALTKATAQVIQNGLYLLGIESPERM
jgi:arginyl-tRNA synthetase